VSNTTTVRSVAVAARGRAFTDLRRKGDRTSPAHARYSRKAAHPGLSLSTSTPPGPGERFGDGPSLRRETRYWRGGGRSPPGLRSPAFLSAQASFGPRCLHRIVRGAAPRRECRLGRRSGCGVSLSGQPGGVAGGFLIPGPPRHPRTRVRCKCCFSGAGLHGGCEPGGHSSKLSDLVLAPPGESLAHH
jgi:hypothetical protein